MKIAGDGSLVGLWQCLDEMLKEDIVSESPKEKMTEENEDEVDKSYSETIEELGILSFFLSNYYYYFIFLMVY